MTIAERINLHRCGYSRTEIEALAEAEREEQKTEIVAEPVETTPEGEQVTSSVENVKPDRTDDILNAINKLTLALQAQNVNTKQQPISKTQTVDDLIKII